MVPLQARHLVHSDLSIAIATDDGHHVPVVRLGHAAHRGLGDGDHALIHADIAHLANALALIENVHAIGKGAREAVGIANRSVQICTRVRGTR